MKSVAPMHPSAHRPTSRRRRRALRGVAALASAVLLAGAVAACGSSNSGNSSSSSAAGSASGSTSQAAATGSRGTTDVSIAYAAPIADQMLPSVTDAAGLFKQNGINAKISFLQASSILPALISGQIQFAVLGAPSSEVAAVNGSPLEYVAQWENAIDAQIVANKSAASIKQMNGKTIAISSSGALSDFLVQMADHKYGVSMHEVPLGQLPNQMASFSHGSVDAISGTNPWQISSLSSQVPGAHVVVNFRTDPGYPGVGLVANANWVKSHGSTVVKVLKAIKAGVAYYKSHKSQAVAVIAKQTSEPTAEATAAYEASKSLFSNTIVPTLADQRNVLTQLAYSTPQAKGFDPSKLLNASYAQQAQG